MSAQRAAAKSYSLPPVRRWLAYVDDQLSPDGVEFLKLGLCSEVDFHKLESICKPSQLYDAILEQRPHEEKEVLRLFVHALRQIGGNLRGKHLTESLANYSITKPEPLTSGETQTSFKFFQCLVKIGTKVRGTETESRFKKHFARQLNVHHTHIANVPILFIRLHQAGIVTSEMHQDLVDFLHRHGPKQGLPYLNDFRQETGLTPLEGLGEGNQTPPESSNAESLESSCQVSDGQVPSATKAAGKTPAVHLSCHNQGSGSIQVGVSAGHAGVLDSDGDPTATAPLQNETLTTTEKAIQVGVSAGHAGVLDSDGDPTATVPPQNETLTTTEKAMQVEVSAGPAGVPDSSGETVATGPPKNETLTTTDEGDDDSKSSGSHSDGDGETSEPTDPLIRPPQRSQSLPLHPQRKINVRCCQVCCLASFLMFSVITVVIIIGLGLGVWRRLASSHNAYMLVREGDTIILSEVSTFFDQLMSTMEVALVGESPHVIDVYLLNSDCHNIPITSTSQTTESSNFTNVTQYLMPGSRIHYNVCATSNFSVTERIHFVILDSLQESRTFNPAIDESFAYFKNIHVGRNGTTKCNIVDYRIYEEGYYSQFFFLPKQPLSYEYESTIVINSINITSAGYEQNCTIDEDNEQCNMSLTFGLTEQCVVAVIRNRTDTFHNMYVHVRVTFERRLDGVLGITVAVVSVSLIISLLVGMATVYNIKRPKQTSERSLEMTVTAGGMSAM